MAGPTMSAGERRRWLYDSAHGRADGWTVELAGRVVGELHDYRWDDMFWCSYAVRRFDPVDSPLDDDELWQQGRFEFRSRTTRELVRGAFPGGRPPFVRDDRVLMRGLHLDATPWFVQTVRRALDLVPRRNRSRWCCDAARCRFDGRHRFGEFIVAATDDWTGSICFFSGFIMAHRHDYADVLATLRAAHAAHEELGISNIKLLTYGGVSYCKWCGANLRRHCGRDGGLLRDDEYVAQLQLPLRD